MKLKFTCRLQKTAGIMTPKGFQAVGIFEQKERVGDEFQCTVKFFKNIPEELIRMIKDMPELLEYQEQRLPAEGIIMIPEIGDK